MKHLGKEVRTQNFQDNKVLISCLILYNGQSEGEVLIGLCEYRRTNDVISLLRRHLKAFLILCEITDIKTNHKTNRFLFRECVL